MTCSFLNMIFGNIKLDFFRSYFEKGLNLGPFSFILRSVVYLENKHYLCASFNDMSFDFNYFNLAFVKLTNGEHQFTYEVNDAFFDYFGNKEISAASVSFNATVIKSDSMIIIDLKGKGVLQATCDRCLNHVNFQVNPDFKVIANLNSSEVPTSLNDDINLQLIYLRSSDFEINLATSIYESFLPCIPMVKSCESLENKDCDETVTRIINQTDKADESVDPRWEKLKQLINNKEK